MDVIHRYKVVKIFSKGIIFHIYITFLRTSYQHSILLFHNLKTKKYINWSIKGNIKKEFNKFTFIIL